jgi:hypothetical protein
MSESIAKIIMLIICGKDEGYLDAPVYKTMNNEGMMGKGEFNG